MNSTVLESAWQWREKQGLFKKTQAIRIFHGPGEGKGDFQGIAIDRFNDHYWITQWDDSEKAPPFSKVLGTIQSFLQSKGARSIVGLVRPEKGIAPEAQVFWGNCPEEAFEVQENSCHFWIRLQKTRHPGLFLDHEPLRRWLTEHARNWKVLNTFAYTGSLSVAAAKGGAKTVTTLDLSKPTVQWAKENLTLNQFTDESLYSFISGDVFEWLPRLKRDGNSYDCILLDPPSFSHGKKGRFSTSQDLPKLHTLALDLLAPEGVLITSINSANVSWKKYETDILKAAAAKKMEFQVLRQIDLPETFPTRFGKVDDRYLKGWILRRVK